MQATIPGFPGVLGIRSSFLAVWPVFYLPGYLCSAVAWLFKRTIDNKYFISHAATDFMPIESLRSHSLGFAFQAFDLKMYSKYTFSLGLYTKQYPNFAWDLMRVRDYLNIIFQVLCSSQQSIQGYSITSYNQLSSKQSPNWENIKEWSSFGLHPFLLCDTNSIYDLLRIGTSLSAHIFANALKEEVCLDEPILFLPGSLFQAGILPTKINTEMRFPGCTENGNAVLLSPAYH